MENIMKIVASGLANSKTTVAGTALGAGMYVQSAGLVLPHDQASWIAFAVAALIQILGLLAKDATTGSQP